MKEENIKIKSSYDGLELDTTMFIPNGKILGIVQLSHGMVEDKKYYYDFMKYLTKNGFVTIINDHRGHGNSIKDKEDLGYFYDEEGLAIVDDLYEVTKYVKKKFPKLSVTLLGHSMGSLVVRCYLKKYDKEIDKLIVCGSPSINNMSKMGLNICKLFKKIKGDRYRSKFLNNMALSNDPNYNWLSYDRSYVKKYSEDKNCGYIFTVNGFINLMHLMINTYNDDYEVNNKDLDILFIAGEDDIVIKNRKLWMKSIDCLRGVGYKKIDYILYSRMKHAILNEKDKSKVYEDVLDFIKS